MFIPGAHIIFTKITVISQIVGLTASLGVGKAIKGLDAQKHILQLCANLDAMQLVTVKENIDELNQFVSTPRQNIYSGEYL